MVLEKENDDDNDDSDPDHRDPKEKYHIFKLEVINLWFLDIITKICPVEFRYPSHTVLKVGRG